MTKLKHDSSKIEGMMANSKCSQNFVNFLTDIRTKFPILDQFQIFPLSNHLIPILGTCMVFFNQEKNRRANFICGNSVLVFIHKENHGKP